MVLLPFSTSIILTEEFLALDESIGGTIQTRVGTAVKGVGHISTMLGPFYMGRLAVPVHNPTADIICLEVGSQFLSIIFHRLNTKSKEPNHTEGAHVNKFSEWGISLDEKMLQEIKPEDLKSFDTYVQRMRKDENFLDYAKENSWISSLKNVLHSWFTPERVISVVILTILILVEILIGGKDKMDPRLETVIITIIVTIALSLIQRRK